MFRAGPFDKLLDKATSHLLMEPDYSVILQICDLIRQDDVQPKYAIAAVKKKLLSPNPHSALYALLVLESMIKNCGSVVHEELSTKVFCEFLSELVKTTHENVRQKLLELIQTWSFAFRKNPKHGALKDLMEKMKADGYKFPALRESDAMFAATTAPEWADGDVCHRCRVAFGLMQRKHHCRACGQVFCGQCTSKNSTLPKYGIEKEVRVCDSCYEQATKPTAGSKAAQQKQDSELPPEYLKSSLAQQSQDPPKKNEDELREEEELQLALALSQSEAEAKEKEKFKITSAFYNNYNKAPEPVIRSPTPPEDVSNPELARYLNRSYWESLNKDTSSADQARPTSPSAPVPTPTPTPQPAKVEEFKYKLKENGVAHTDLEDFISTLKSQVEIFINRMKSNSSRGRSIANDTSVQTLFMNITAMHSKLLRYIQEHDDSRLHYERLQDKLTQVKDARAALDALREEHRERLRREAEEAERQRQLQMAHKLEIMRKKKQEYLQYQRQLALQRIQEQEREMQMRQEQQKQQYLMGPQFGVYSGSPAHAQQFPPNSAPPAAYYQYPGMGQPMPGQQPLPQAAPTQIAAPPGLPQQQLHHVPQAGPPGFSQSIPSTPNNTPNQTYPQPQMVGIPLQQGQVGSHLNQQGMPQGGVPQGMPQGGVPQATMPPQVGMPPQSGIPPQSGMPPHSGLTAQGGIVSPPQQFAQAAIQSPQQQLPQKEEAETAELISFD